MKKTVISICLCSLVSCIIMSCGPSQGQYDKLVKENESLKAEVSKLNAALKECKAEIERYQTTPDRLYAEALDAIDKKDINRLGEICGRFDKYQPNSAESKKAKDALAKLIQERDRAIMAEKAKRMQAVNKLKKNYDDVSGITWYYNPYFTHYNDSNHASVYMGKRESGKPWLRLKMSYYGDDWIFFEEAYLSYDGKTKSIPFDKYNDKKTDNYTTVWEWIDVGVDDGILAFLKEMIDGKSVKMRLSGKYSSTRTLSKREIDGIRDVLLAYDVLLNGE